MSTLLEAARAHLMCCTCGPNPNVDWTCQLCRDLRAAIAEAEQAPAVVTAEEIAAIARTGGYYDERVAAIVAERTAQAVEAAREAEQERWHQALLEAEAAVETARAEEREALTAIVREHRDEYKPRRAEWCALDAALAVIRARTPASEGKP